MKLLFQNLTIEQSVWVGVKTHNMHFDEDITVFKYAPKNKLYQNYAFPLTG